MIKNKTDAAIMKKFRLGNIQKDHLPYNGGQRHTRYHLAQLFGELKFNKGAEIGVRRGRFSKYLCKCNPDLELFLVDPWSAYSAKYNEERQEKIYQEMLQNTKGLNVKVIRKTSIDALSDFEDGSLDFVFIDGDHTFDYVAPDLIYWSKKVRQGGIVALHDYYSWSTAGVVKAVDAYVFCHKIDPWYVTKELQPTAFWVKP